MGNPGPDREYDDDEILAFIHQSYGPVVGTADVADHFGITGEGARKYLSRLEEEGFIESTGIGRATVWWLTPAGERRVAPG